MSHSFLSSSVGKKYVMAVTGLVLFGFVIGHMLGNLQIFLGRDALNEYAHFLQEATELLWLARIVLLVSFVTHIVTAVLLAKDNRAARPVRYRHENTVQASYSSRTMMMSGLIVLAFVVYHLLHFTYAAVHPQYFYILDPEGRHDVYSMVVLSFRDFPIAAAYILAMLPLCMHISHGFQSLFQSLGLNHPRYTPALRRASQFIGLLVLAGNTSIPVACLLGWLPVPGAH